MCASFAAWDRGPPGRMRQLLRHPARFPAPRSNGRTVAALWSVFAAPSDAHARLHLRDSDILPSTSREALFLALARAACEPRNWGAALRGSCFSFEDGRSLFLFTCRMTAGAGQGAVWEWFLSKTAVHELCALPEDAQYNPAPGDEAGLGINPPPWAPPL